MQATAPPLALAGHGLHKRFGSKGAAPVEALTDISLEVPAGTLSALVGPDGAGKTTLLRLAAGLMRADQGSLQVLGIDVAREPQGVQDRISYMPQRFGLYEDLSVQENLDLYADLHGVATDQRRERYARLMEMTDLGRFTTRPAGKLSGGMKQKLGLACTLVRSPALLLLDEPTVGVDPLSRRELWEIVQRLVDDEQLSVIVSTAYLDEAERCARVFVLLGGRLIAQGAPAQIRDQASDLCFVAAPPEGTAARHLQARLLDDQQQVIDAVPRGGEVRFIRRPDADQAALAALLQGATAEPVAPRLEDGFMVLLRAQQKQQAPPPEADAHADVASPSAYPGDSNEVVIEVKDLVRKFGDFTAVARTSFEVHRGEIFGLLGPNGAGKTTTFRMLCGLLPASSGFLQVAGVDLRTARAQARARIGYVSQKFALYGNLSVLENLRFFGGAYGLRGPALERRIRTVLQQFDLQGQEDSASGSLPGGFRQRLAMATGLLHEPEILFLDEPTSGADPLARREFWRRITALAEAGVTVIITTHFMEEAEYCDRIVIQDAGKLLAIGTPQQVRIQAGSAPDAKLGMEQAFIDIVTQARESAAVEGSAPPAALQEKPEAAARADVPKHPSRPIEHRAARSRFWQRLGALTRKETRQLMRDPSSLAIGILLPIVLILIFGYGLSLDVRNAPIAVVLEDSSPTAVQAVSGLQLTPYISPLMLGSMHEAELLLGARKVDGIVRLPGDFSRRLAAGDASIQVIVQGADANRASIVLRYASAALAQNAVRTADRDPGSRSAIGSVAIEERLWFNAANTSTWYLVPGLIVLIMTLVGAFLTALVMAREWERGTLEALFVTPVRPVEILLAKVIPYFGIGMMGLLLCLLASRFLFEVPMYGSLAVIVISAMLYLIVAVGIGLVISSVTRNQFLASQVALVSSFLPSLMLSGFLFDLRNVPAVVRIVGRLLPATYFMDLIRSLFLAGNVWPQILRDCGILLAYAVLLLGVARFVTRKSLD